MKKFFLPTLSLLISLTLLGCFESDTEAEIGNKWNLGNYLEKSVVLSKSKSISESDTIWCEFTVEEGVSYEVRREYKGGYEIGLIIAPPNMDTLDVYKNYFKAITDGICRVGLYVQYIDDDYIGPFEYNLKVKKCSSLPEQFIGKWLLVKENGAAFSSSSEFNYPLSELTKVIEFKDDSIITYYYDTYDDSVSVDARLFASSWLSEMSYRLSGNSLTFSAGNHIGGYAHTYDKYTGSLEDIQWGKKDFKASSELIGTWYLSSEKWREYEEESDGIDDASGDDTYNSGVESRKIYVITSDTITKYYKYSGWQIEVESNPVEESYWFLSQCKIIDGTLSFIECETEIWTNSDGTEACEAWLEEEIYSKYTGELPPGEWTEIVIPTVYSDMKLGDSFSGSLKANDSLWFRIPVSYGKDYHFTVTSADFDTFLAMVSEDKDVIGSNDDIGDDLLSQLEFTSVDNGFYYALLTGYSSSCSGDFVLSYTTRSLSSKNATPSQKQKRKTREKRFSN